MTLVTTLMVGMNLLSDIGLLPSVIQSAIGDEESFLNTIWTLQVLRGIMLFLGACALTIPVANFYRDPTLLRLAPLLASTALIGAFNSTNLLSLARHMQVRRLFAIDFSSSVFALAITLALAWKWHSVWAIAFGQVAGVLYKLTVSHIPGVTPGIRNRFAWDRDSASSIVRFGKWIFLGTALYFFGSQADRLILGRLVSLRVLGIYTLAYSLSDIPRQVFLALGNRVFYPFVARMIEGPRDHFLSTYFRYRGYVLMLGAVLLAAMVLWGPMLITGFYDSRYHDAQWIIPILAVGLWHTLMYQTVAPVLFALDKPSYNAFGNLGYCIVMMLGIPLAFTHFGLLGAVVVIAAGDLPLYLILTTGAMRLGVRSLSQDAWVTAFFAALLACGDLLHKWMPVSGLFHLTRSMHP